MSDAHTHPQPTNQPADPPRPVDDFVTTVHELQLPAGLLRYRAQAGRMVIGSEIVKEGVFAGLKPKAQIFLTSYTAIAEGTDDGQDAQRPVVFVFNGGPGSSSAWMHIGLFGPRRVVANDVNDRTPPPYGLVDNIETTLAHADLVFIDPVTTGYSRTAEGRSRRTSTVSLGIATSSARRSGCGWHGTIDGSPQNFSPGNPTEPPVPQPWLDIWPSATASPSTESCSSRPSSTSPRSISRRATKLPTSTTCRRSPPSRTITANTSGGSSRTSSQRRRTSPMGISARRSSADTDSRPPNTLG